MRAEPHVFVVLGATGDLTARKLLPALYELLADDEDDPCHVVGAATTVQDDAAFRASGVEALAAAGVPRAKAEAWATSHLFYEPVSRDGAYDALARRVEKMEAEHGLPGNRVIYLALPPAAFPTTIEAVGAAGLQSGPGWTRLVVEKPFGSDLESARSLNRVVHAHFSENEVYRIDHYLGKETVRNLLVFRFTNPIFESSWNRDRIERVEITVAESLGVGARGKYYDAAGVLRDMIQSHITQLLTLVAMEAPTSFEADAIRTEKVKVLRSIRDIPERAIVLGQYGEGVVGGKSVPAYRTLPGVAPDSSTATFAAVRVWIDNWRWQGVPFFLRTGKALARRVTEIAVTFRRPPVCLVHLEKDDCLDHSNVLTLTMQPDEGFSLDIDVKQPGDIDGVRTIPLHFSYAEAFGDIPDAYETLIADVIEGDQTLFVRGDEVEESWRLYSPTLAYPLSVHPYAAGTWGPEDAATLLGDGARPWATGD